MSQRALQKDVERQIAATHRRFVKAMDARIPSLSPEMQETYFALLSKLVAKLETEDKSLRDVMQEMMTEAMGEVLQMLQA